MAERNRGREAYSAWFADRGAGVLYFGLSPFWELLDAGGPSADLREPGDQLIGRFALRDERFLEPLRVGSLESGARAAVWDVLAHSSGWVCYTTFFEQAGCVDPLSGAVRRFSPLLGAGLNELAEGPGGNLYVTRYDGLGAGSVLVLRPDGMLLHEFALRPSALGFAAAKSVAVDPVSGEIWLNTDTFDASGAIHHEQLRLSAQGAELERRAEPELLFMRFDAQGRGWFAQERAGQLELRVRAGGRELARAALGPRAPADFVQDISFAADGSALLALWSGRVWWARLRSEPPAAPLALRSLELERPAPCQPPRRALFYSAVLEGESVYATLACGARVLRAALGRARPAEGAARVPGPAEASILPSAPRAARKPLRDFRRTRARTRIPFATREDPWHARP